jgi:hypothetical protein
MKFRKSDAPAALLFVLTAATAPIVVSTPARAAEP